MAMPLLAWTKSTGRPIFLYTKVLVTDGFQFMYYRNEVFQNHFKNMPSRPTCSNRNV